MTIVKAIALAALTGTLAFGPQVALASSHKNDPPTEHGNSATAKADKAETAKTARDAAKVNTPRQDPGDGDDEEDAAGDIAANGELRVGPIVSALRGGNFTSETTSLNGSVTEIDLSELPGNSEVAVVKALEGADLPDAQVTIQASADASTEVEAALAEIDDEETTHAFVNADGTLVVVVP